MTAATGMARRARALPTDMDRISGIKPVRDDMAQNARFP